MASVDLNRGLPAKAAGRLVDSAPGIQEYRCSDWNCGEPLISVIVQTYQHAPFIEQCLESICRQATEFPFEVLVGEDGSHDGTRERCCALAERYPHLIRLVLHDRSNVIRIQGVPTGRFNMLTNFRRARGKYLAFCEGDDYWTDPQKLQRQTEFMEAHPQFPISFHNVCKVDAAGNVLVPQMLPAATCRDRTPREVVAWHTPIPTPAMMLRGEYVRRLPPQFSQVMTADLFMCSYLAQFGGAGFVEVGPSAYRIHGGGIFSREKEAARIAYVLGTYRALLEVLPAELRPIAGLRLCEKYQQLVGLHVRQGAVGLAGRQLGHYVWDAVTRVGWRAPWFQARLMAGAIRRAWRGSHRDATSGDAA